MNFVTRFAPSPTGLLHLGHAFSALTAFDAARGAGGRFLLRIEDIDQTRCRAEYEAAIYEDLAWLGVEWMRPVRRQSEHLSCYARTVQTLAERGLVYRCFRTRKEVLEEIARAPHHAASGPDGPAFFGSPLSKDEEEERLARGEAYAWRLSMHEALACVDRRALVFREEMFGGARDVEATPLMFGDLVVARKDAGASYHLASVHDDALQEVTHVIRGEDLFASTHAHRLLQELLGYPRPTYRHHALLADEAGRKFSKRNAARALAALRAQGAAPEEIRRGLGL